MAKEHGMSIALKKSGENGYVEVKMYGQLSHEDYQKGIPMIEAAMQNIPKGDVCMLADIKEVDGWDMRAMLDDFQFGMKYKNSFQKLAVVGNRTWMEYSTDIASKFSEGEMKYFENSDDAVAWLTQH